MIRWPDGVRKRASRDSTWTLPVGVIADKTRCGRKKIRPALTVAPASFSVSMKIRYDEYIIFKNWYENALRNGANPFGYPNLDSDTGEIKEYRFVEGSTLSVSNPSGKIIVLQMQWEEV